MIKTIFSLLLIVPGFIFGEIAVSLPANSSSETNAGITSAGQWSSKNGGFQLNWSITQNKSGSYDYLYSFTQSSGKDLKNNPRSFVLQLNEEITPKDLSSIIVDSSAEFGEGPQLFKGGEDPVKYASGNIYGVEFALGGKDSTLSFTSTNAPVWGSFYAETSEGSGKTYAYNAGFGTDPKGEGSLTNWVPTVGGSSVLAPEPSTMLLIGCSLVMIAFLKRRASVRSS